MTFGLRLIGVLPALLALTSCAPTREWVRPGFDEAANRRDYEACRQQAYVDGQRLFREETFPPRPGSGIVQGANPLPAPMDRFGMSIGTDTGSLRRLEWQATRDRAYQFQRRALAACLTEAGFRAVPAAER